MCSWFHVLPSASVVRLATPLTDAVVPPRHHARVLEGVVPEPPVRLAEVVQMIDSPVGARPRIMIEARTSSAPCARSSSNEDPTVNATERRRRPRLCAPSGAPGYAETSSGSYRCGIDRRRRARRRPAASSRSCARLGEGAPPRGDAARRRALGFVGDLGHRRGFVGDPLDDRAEAHAGRRRRRGPEQQDEPHHLRGEVPGDEEVQRDEQARRFPAPLPERARQRPDRAATTVKWKYCAYTSPASPGAPRRSPRAGSVRVCGTNRPLTRADGPPTRPTAPRRATRTRSPRDRPRRRA